MNLVNDPLNKVVFRMIYVEFSKYKELLCFQILNKKLSSILLEVLLCIRCIFINPITHPHHLLKRFQPLFLDFRNKLQCL